MLVTFGINHQTAPLAVRERIAFQADTLPDSLRELAGLFDHAEVSVLSTCNRTEIYLACTDTANAKNIIPAWMAQRGGLETDALQPHLYVLNQTETVRHAFRVASGLDSMVLGEPQILGQLKDAVRIADDSGCLSTHLHALFQRTFAVAKEVRSNTEIGQHSVSMAAAAVKLAKRIFENLESTSVLMIGAGEMIELCATHIAAQRPRKMVIANRTLDRATKLASNLNATAMSLREIPEQLEHFDIVVSCTASTLPILGLGMVQRASKARRHRPMLMVDLAVPRDIEADVSRLDDVFLYTVDDLSTLVQQGSTQRLMAVSHADAIINEQVRSFLRWLDARAAVPLIQHLRQQGENIRLAELEAAKKRLAKGGDPYQVLEQMSHGLNHKYLHGPMSLLHSTEGHDREYLHRLLPKLFTTRQPNSRTKDATESLLPGSERHED